MNLVELFILYYSLDILLNTEVFQQGKWSTNDNWNKNSCRYLLQQNFQIPQNI